jgi:uncharacterized protein (TIGR03083 family)
MTTAESWESLHSTEEFVAMQRVVNELFALLDGLPASDWERATRCPPLDVRALVAHIAGSFAFVRTWLIANPEGPARIDRSTMWRSFPDEAPRDVVQAAAATSDGKSATELDKELRTAVQRFIETAASVTPEQLAACPMFGDDFVLSARDVVANRVLEVGVHLLDIQAAVGLPEVLPEASTPVIRSILDGLLGESAPDELGWDGVRYALIGTGRAELTRSEHDILGELAACFPLLQ